MTLTKSIEQARTALKYCSQRNIGVQTVPLEVSGEAARALFALPDSPMSEKEIRDLLELKIGTLFTFESALIVRVLKEANVLYVED